MVVFYLLCQFYFLVSVSCAELVILDNVMMEYILAVLQLSRCTKGSWVHPGLNLLVQVHRSSKPEPGARFRFLAEHAPAPQTGGSVQVHTQCSRFMN